MANEPLQRTDQRVLDSVKIVCVKPLLGIADNGRTYSIPRRMVGDILED